MCWTARRVELRSAELARALAHTPGKAPPALAPIYLIAGDETLLVEEACDSVLEAARHAGFEEREVLRVESGFDWQRLGAAAASLSLFATRRIIDLRVPDSAFGREGGEALAAYAAHPPEDTLLLIRAGRLDARQRGSAWHRAVAAAGVVVTIWPVNANELPRWLEERLRKAGVTVTRDALTLFAERVEGNLLAAVQEVQKLALQGLPQPLDTEALLGVLEDAANFDAFELVDATLGGDARRVARVIRALEEAGVAVFAVLGALVSQLRRLRAGEYLPPQRQRMAAEFLRRVGGPDGVERMLAICALIDAQGKGEVPGDPWRSLSELLLRAAGVRLLPGPSGLTLLRGAARGIG
ncbi:MAG TPA: DNA polymerase III subunit delta [Gammaproteobacteria bacterium]|jgi:DNA polymerase-3 subunit delta|nr:DNA polymerase III subunit delta [Gammaproteobacteria bacterium]